MHALRPGDTLQIAAVRNTFLLECADSYLFIAGGIGITPLLPMVRAVARDGGPFKFIYLGRSCEQMAFVDVVRALGKAAVVIETDHEGIPDSRRLLQAQPAASVYACGPAGLLDDLEKFAPQILGSGSSLHTERFQPAKPKLVEPEAEITLVCSRSGLVVRTDPSMSFLESLRQAGLAIPSSCEMGICGTCQVLVTAGIPQHNDMLLTQAEREAGAFLPCVSRSQSRELTIDL
jgi:ferredoxin-NADP reductase